MFDFLRDLTKSAEEKRQERLNAYLDGELSPGEQRRFEQALEQDPALQVELAELRAVKQGIRQLPRVRAPRNFTLDPAVYSKPQPQPAVQLYPVFRVATALTAIFFVLALALDLLTPAGGVGQPLALAPAAEDGIAVTTETQRQESEPSDVTPIVAEELLEGESAAEEMPEAAVAADEAEEPLAAEEEMEAPAGEADTQMTAPAAAEAAPTAAPSPTGRAQGGALVATATLTPTATAAATATPAPSATPRPQPTAPPPPPEPAEPLPWLLIIEVGLGVGVVVLFVTTLLLRRRL